jgi:ABC-type amino acid transport substrate-binding protein
MKLFLSLILFCCCIQLFAANNDTLPTVVTIPYMDVEASHRHYADALLAKALELSEKKYGPYKIVMQQQESVIRRQLVELEKGTSISVAVSMPTPEWLDKALPVRFPLMKGISSYRLFLGHKDNQALFATIKSLDDLKKLSIGQGPGWSTGKILEDNGFNVVYGGPYSTLIPMLGARRFQLLMRGIFEVEPELKAYKNTMPELTIIKNVGIYTYLPMYFFVAKNQPLLAERIEYGLKKAHANGQLDQLFKRYFSHELTLLKNKNLTFFYIPNTNIDNSFFEQDKPYLLNSIIRLEDWGRKSAANLPNPLPNRNL